jgi:hypothetical protein
LPGKIKNKWCSFFDTHKMKVNITMPNPTAFKMPRWSAMPMRW